MITDIKTIGSILNDVYKEVDRQEDLWGQQHHPMGTSTRYKHIADDAREVTNAAADMGTLSWLHILREEYCEAVAEEDWDKLRVELVQVAAVCVSMIRDGDSKDAS